MSSPRFRAALAAPLGLGLALALLAQCSAPEQAEEHAARSAAAGVESAAAATASAAALAGWEVVYDVLQHPRCVNCHPGGDVPLQGDAGLPHAQLVQRGPDGNGLFAMRCATCHQRENTPGPHMPPGAPSWHLPHPDAPLVFQGRSSAELCRQLKDPDRNGGRTPEELLAHVAADPLVLWGWSPGDGRTPVPIPHADFYAAAFAWVEGGCACPE
jgi:hypothetical protein